MKKEIVLEITKEAANEWIKQGKRVWKFTKANPVSVAFACVGLVNIAATLEDMKSAYKCHRETIRRRDDNTNYFSDKDER